MKQITFYEHDFSLVSEKYTEWLRLDLEIIATSLCYNGYSYILMVTYREKIDKK